MPCKRAKPQAWPSISSMQGFTHSSPYHLFPSSQGSPLPHRSCLCHNLPCVAAKKYFRASYSAGRMSPRGFVHSNQVGGGEGGGGVGGGDGGGDGGGEGSRFCDLGIRHTALDSGPMSVSAVTEIASVPVNWSHSLSLPCALPENVSCTRLHQDGASDSSSSSSPPVEGASRTSNVMSIDGRGTQLSSPARSSVNSILQTKERVR